MKNVEMQNLQFPPLHQPGRTGPLRKDPLTDFRKILSNSVKEVNQAMQQADQSIQEMALGRMDIHNAMIDIEKASLSFRLLMQVRNRMITAYEEIMRMQF